MNDNTALHHALQCGKVQPIFIFDRSILDGLDPDDARLSYIHDSLKAINDELAQHGSAIKTYYGDPEEIWSHIITTTEVETVFYNKDYEPYALSRDKKIQKLLRDHQISFKGFKDQVIFEENEVIKADGNPYTIFTPYKNKWLSQYSGVEIAEYSELYKNFLPCSDALIPLNELGFTKSNVRVKPFRFSGLNDYHLVRDYPARNQTSLLSPHLRFGTISVRECVNNAFLINDTFLSELIWREFFMQILFHFPQVVDHCFKPKYENIAWRNNAQEYEAWCRGETGYPLVDAGMRQLNETGIMHNRVRMVTASFLVKHLLIDWRWGEAYFAKKLLDYDLAANNGNWQWAAGTGCDSAPYFRIFNPIEQLKKFDGSLAYTKTWVKDLDKSTYPQPLVDHKYARERCLSVYKSALQ